MIAKPAFAGFGTARSFCRCDQSVTRFFTDLVGPEVPWNRTTWITVSALVFLWAALFSLTWATWGDLTIDCGREMYVPAVLSEGKTLYKDVWFGVPPAAPYLNSFLFRLFGIHLNVLYWAGSLSALGSAVFLFLTGLRLGSSVIGWTAGAVVIVQAFAPWLFSFPLPYSFSSVYGCLVTCIYVWLLVGAAKSTKWLWVFGAGMAAAAALMLRIEFGTACYVVLLLLIAARGFQRRTWKGVLKDALAIMPGFVLCLAVIRWMLSLGGVEFITQENLLSWPTSYFMKAYGKVWLEFTGFTLTNIAFAQALLRLSTLAGVVLGFRALLGRARSPRAPVYRAAQAFLLALLTLALLVPSLPWQADDRYNWICFPRDMVLIVGVAAILAWWHFFRNFSFKSSPAFPLLFTFSSTLAFRQLMGMRSVGYPIYYNGPSVLCFLFLLAAAIVPPSRHSPTLSHQAKMLVCFGCILAAAFHSTPILVLHQRLVPLMTERGTIYVSRHMSENYQAAIAFLKEKASAGESVLSVPEDTSLYFLSGTHCPVRVCAFTPGVLAPGKMTEEVIREIDRKPVRYLLWSNRDFSVGYGTPIFGVDFDRPVGDYLKSHYGPVRSLIPNQDSGWNAVIWERLPGPGPSQ
jgi:hypothetical protein